MVHLIVDDMTIYSEVYWVNDLIIAIFLVTVKVGSLPSMAYDALALVASQSAWYACLSNGRTVNRSA